MRKSKPKKRILLPDPKFNDVLVTRFVNDLMVDGKKSIAFRIFYDAIDICATVEAGKKAGWNKDQRLCGLFLGHFIIFLGLKIFFAADETFLSKLFLEHLEASFGEYYSASRG